MGNACDLSGNNLESILGIFRLVSEIPDMFVM